MAFVTIRDKKLAGFYRNIMLNYFFCFQSDFSSEDFAHMSAPLLYTMFKAKTKFPLHSAVRLKREDVVFLFLIEYNQEVG